MGLRIRELRKDRGWTGEMLAEVVGITKGYVSEIETGKKAPGADLLLRLADAFRIEVYELFDGTDDERKDAALSAHLAVMRELDAADRLAVERAALGLLAKKRGS